MTAGPDALGAARRALARRLFRDLPAGQRETAELDARLLTAAALGIEPTELLTYDGYVPSAAEAATLGALAGRRIAGEPVARILGRKEFWSLSLQLSADTLVPRPDTEVLVSAALAAAGTITARPLSILDIGTGSGAILLALLAELPDASGVGTDRASAALVTAEANSVALGLHARSTFVLADWADVVRGPFHLVVSNPPYVPSAEIDRLDREVRLHDPRLALDGGADGLDPYRAIIPELPRLLDVEGRALLEVGAGQAGPVSEIAERHGYSFSVHRDLAGHERVVELHR